MKTILIDFDGVIHSYVKPWQGADIIPDPPVPGAIKWLIDMVTDGRFEVCIYSSRSTQVGGVAAMQAWLTKHGMTDIELAAVKFPTEKPPAFLTIDDRCFCFEGRFPELSDINDFKPWNKKNL